MLEDVTKTVAEISEVHLKLLRRNGVLMFYGVKPQTILYAVEVDYSNGYPMPKFHSIL